MLKRILRFALLVILLAVVSAGIVTIIGIVRKWESSIQYSNAFFLGGIILAFIGSVNFIGMNNQDDYSNRAYKLVNSLDKDAGIKTWTADINRGLTFMAFVGSAGLLLWLVAVLIPLFWK